MKTLPKKFTVTITEEDRQKADGFCRNESCLLATAVRRQMELGQDDDISEGVTSMCINGERYRHVEFPRGDLSSFVIVDATDKPFYQPHVVGKRTTFRLEEFPA